MTEAQWLACDRPGPLLDYLGSRASDRKLRLWACACVRRIAHLIPHPIGRQALAVSERFADGLADQRELLAIADAFYPCGLYNATYDHPATRAAHAPLYRETVGQAAVYAARCRKPAERPGEEAAQAALLRDIFGNPFQPLPPWPGGVGATLAQAIYEDHAFDRLPILADVLEEAGCTQLEVVAHCRAGGTHARGCWVVDWLLTRE